MDIDVEFIITQIAYLMQLHITSTIPGELQTWANIINAAIRLEKKIK